ncbi:nSTAND3 domain-containing NTPase, partial [Parabacteroides provencensis]|uniref:nSTAND3 domain-containing NTPase n=1 Tax=Parabacteroides provencensis TaxID=1944636 RepID=UPI00130459F7
PLSNTFYGRESEIDDGLVKLDKSDILIVTGAPGVGKTRLGIELCKRFTSKYDEYKFYCLTNFNTEDVYTAFHSIIQKQGKIIVFIDDANRVGGNYSAILHHLKMVEKGNLKIVVSVRDYALESILAKTYDYHYETTEILCFSDEDISNILDSNGFNFSYACKYRINLISRGNARLAMMCAKVARETNRLDSLRNVSELFELYFSPIYNDVIKASGEDSLKVLGIISFFRVLHREYEEPNNIIYREFEISSERFWSVCKTLNDLELVDLYENDVVKISDQILATYIHYKAFFSENILSYKTIINCFMDKHNHINDSIIPLVNSFGYESIESQIKQCVEPIFDEIDSSSDHSKLMLLIDSFWFFLPNKSLFYLKRWIEQLDSMDEDFIFEFDNNHYAFHSTPKELEVLSNLGTKNFDYTEPALDLMFQIILRQPLNTPFLIKILEDEWMIGRFSIDNNYHLQHALVDFAAYKISNSDEKHLYSKMLIRIANSLLKTEFRDTECRGNKFTMYSGHVSSDKLYLDLRKKTWTILFTLTDTHPLEFRRLLSSHSRWYDKETVSIYQFDLSILMENIKMKFSESSFLDCYVVHHFFEHYKWMKVKFDKSILSTFSCHLINVLKVFSPSEDRRSFSDSLKVKQSKICNYCRGYKLPQYIKLLSDINEITEVKKQLNEQHIVSYEQDVMNAIIVNCPDLYIDVLKYISSTDINKIRPYSVWQYVQLENADISRLINVITEQLELPHRTNWLLQVYSSIPESKFTLSFVDEVHLILSQNSLTGVDFYPILQIIENSKEFIPVN